MSPSLTAFFDALDRWTRQVPLPDLMRRLEHLHVELDELGPFVQFDPVRYRRNLLHAAPAYQALVLCWRAAQRSPIHDHRGSSCGVRVLRGVATETLFARTSAGLIYATRSRELPAGSVCGSLDMDIHQVSNLQADGCDLITLHVYSPPLLHMGVYSLTDATRHEYEDPIHAGVVLDGSGI
jgi:cysteine dioxygenase